jgi:hypothetical protein
MDNTYMATHIAVRNSKLRVGYLLGEAVGEHSSHMNSDIKWDNHHTYSDLSRVMG